MNELDFLSRRFIKLKPFRFRLKPGNEITYNPICFEGSNNVRRFHKGDEGQFRKLYLHRFSKIFRDKVRNKVIRPELSILLFYFSYADIVASGDQKENKLKAWIFRPKVTANLKRTSITPRREKNSTRWNNHSTISFDSMILIESIEWVNVFYTFQSK